MQSRYLLIYVVFFLAISQTALQGQLRYLQADAHFGSIVQHRTTIAFDTESPSYGLDLSMYWQTQGNKPWQAGQQFPRFYLSARFQDLGNREVLGQAYGLLGGMELNLFRRQKSALHFGFGFGYSYLTKPFDRVSNPTNNAIGSFGNNSITLHLDYERPIGKKLIYHLGLKLMHYSNGARKLPNLGLNIPALYIGISPNRGTYEQDFFNFDRLDNRPGNRFAIGLYTQYAQVEIRVPGGPNYPVYVFGGDVYYHHNANHRSSIGYQYEYNSSIAIFGLHTGDFQTDDEALVGASRHAINVGHEFLFGPWSVQLKTGFYINRNSGWLLPTPYYFQLSPRYYFLHDRPSRTKFYANIQLKSHLFIAEYISVGVGMVFR